MSSGDVGMYVSVGDVSVSCLGDMELCGVDSVVRCSQWGSALL